MPAMMLQRPCLSADRSHAPAWAPDAPASPDGIAPSPGGVLFFVCPKKRTKRKGSPAAETTPVDGLRNRRGKNSLRSDSLPLVPGSAPRRPAQRQRAVFLPRKPVMTRTVLLAGPAFRLVAGHSEGDRSHAPAWERRPGRSSVTRMASPPRREAFFSLPAQRKEPKERAALSLRRPWFDGLRNRRGKNSLRSDSLPLVPGSAPRRPAQRQRAVVLPRKPVILEPSSRRGQRSASWRGILRAIVPTLQRGNGVVTLQRHQEWHRPLAGRRSFLCLPKEKNQKKGQPCR